VKNGKKSAENRKITPHAYTFYSDKFPYTICETSISNWCVLFVCVGEAVSPRNLSRVFIASAANHSARGESSTRYVSIYANKRSISSRDILALSSPVPKERTAKGAGGGAPAWVSNKMLQITETRDAPGLGVSRQRSPLISHNFPRAHRPIYHIIGRDVYPLVRAVGVCL